MNRTTEQHDPISQLYLGLDAKDTDSPVSVILKLRGETCDIDCLYCYEKRKEAPGGARGDYTDEPAVFARDLIHEASHNWLNDALTATNCELSEEAVFYSPWRQTKRPAFGFLHACWAFPLTMIYTARVLPQTSGAVHHFLTAYLDQQRVLLAATTDDHPQALALIADPELRQRLHAVHTEALSL
ncbi:HEXXH motif-containing putative peptide modification protein [Streptomyces sp. NPDC058405]|uniref:aKG-HExxH-type peptide beta-hydroxylase n=1 Tax=unclassified Streptomyces TaxID=2593676 RepID=UPI003650113F